MLPSLFQALGSWGRGKKREREKKNEGGLRLALVLTRFRSSPTTESLEQAICCLKPSSAQFQSVVNS